MRSLFAEAARQTKSGPVVLATIVAHTGSAPRTSGARMLVLPGGEIKGTVGGGRYEAEAIALGLTMLESCADANSGSHHARLMFFPLNEAGDMDLICGGEVLLLLELIQASRDDAAGTGLLARAAQAERDGLDFVFAAQLEFQATDIFSPASTFPAPEGAVRRQLVFPDLGEKAKGNSPAKALPKELEVEAAKALRKQAPSLTQSGGEIWLFEPFPAARRVFIAGAGHVSVALARLAESVGFAVTVLDDRPEFANSARFPQAEIVVPPSLAESDLSQYFSGAKPGPRDAVVIVTRGHAFDRDALAAALRTGAGYIGMIGSASKRGQVYQSLRECGFTNAALEKVYSPIGLSIGAETPEEIAVSIMAQLIAWRRDAL